MELLIQNVTKRFGDKTALGGVSLSARSGQPLGLLGRNGAGKTTLMRIIMNIFLPDSGTVTLDGRPTAEQVRSIGYLPEERGLYARMPIGEQLCYIARLRGMSREEAVRACDYWLSRLSLQHYRKAKPETLSKGNQQRIQLALALINDPDAVILDEPFSGLDPVNALQLRSIVSELADSGKLVIISSHQMSTVETLCSHVAMLNAGKVVLDADLADLHAKASGGSVRIRTSDDSAALALLSPFGDAAQTRDGLTLTLDDACRKDELLRTLSDSPLEVLLFEQCAPSLEELFVTMCGDDKNTAAGEDNEKTAGTDRHSAPVSNTAGKGGAGR